jgi:2-isopropylmalate synthase
MSDQVVILDTTLRDGEQSAGVCFTKAEKLEIAVALAAMRVDVIEAGFPGASPAEFEAVKAVGETVRTATVCALARANAADIDAAAAALRGAASPRIHVFVNASHVQMAHQLRKTGDEVLALAEAMIRRARCHTDDVQFSAMDATRADISYLADMARMAVRAGATTLNLPDTVGYILPHMLGARIAELSALVPELSTIRLSFHGHDDLGLATANSLEAVRAGVRQIEATINGIGERAGNTALEEVVTALHLHGPALGVHTGVDTRRLCPLSDLVRARSGMMVPPNKAIVGKNAFRHASGIHQDGVLKKRETFEWLDPALVGNVDGTQIVLGKLSGRAGFGARAAALGFALQGAALDAAFARFQVLADQRREVFDDDVRALCVGAQTSHPVSLSLKGEGEKSRISGALPLP